MAVEKVLQILASLVALIGLAPAFLYLAPLAQLTGLAALVAGFIADRSKRQLLPPLPATLLSFGFFLFYLLQMSRNNVVEPLLNMLVLLLAIRLVTDKTGRNLLQIFVLSTFILAASSLLSLSIGYLVSLILLIGLVTFGLLLTSFYASDPTLRLDRRQWLSLLRTGALLPLGSLLLMLVFFALLPRTQYPLWNFLNPGAKANAGFSEEVSPGSLANLGSSGTPAFRVEMQQIDPQELYWRGLLLNRTDGQRWTRDKSAPQDISVPEQKPETQIIYSQPRNDRYLPALDRPAQVFEINANRSADGVFEARYRQDRSHRYRVESSRHGTLQLKNASLRDFYLQVPADTPVRIQKVAAQIEPLPDYPAKIRATTEFFIRQKLSYAASNLQLSESPLDDFLFDSKRGYCEYFASSFALLLRLSGVPSRLVGGYLGGRYNELGGYYLIDEDMAHVWVEALDTENHWQRIDPSRLAINAGAAVTGLARQPFNLSQSLVDFVDTTWNRLVITYDLQTQLGLLVATGRNLGQLKVHLPANRLWWLATLTVVLAGGLSVMCHRRRKTPLESLIERYRRAVCSAAGVAALPANLGLFELGEVSQEPLCQEFSRVIGPILYREQSLRPEESRQLRRIIEQLSKRQLHFHRDLSRVTAPQPGHRTGARRQQPKIDKRLKVP